ncbi:AraC family transcriptional regulator [Thiosulfatihalobacter marinus]|uniref:AraC family transcriptional regulator n=1 Tax=Thiosulfatihalobacter marinus TaxID=2792481 RepID=UPI0018D7F2A7|nr:AraC family transcriptional regulator [Thiosulfatihalobacter marinus]
MIQSAETQPLIRDTTSVAPHRRFAYFCEAICSTFVGIQPERSNNRQFDARFSAHDLGVGQLASIHAPGHRAARDGAMLRRTPDDSVFLNFLPDAAFDCQIGDATHHVPAGTPRVIDNAAAFALHFAPNDRLRLYSLRLPRDRLPPKRKIDALNRQLAHGPGGQFLAAQFRLAALACDSGDSAAIRATGHALVALLEALETGADAPVADVALMKLWAAQHLSDPALGAVMIAGHFRVSPRTVQDRFRRDGTSVGRWVQDRRLRAAWDALRDPAQRFRPVARIALECGFASVAHFNRAFRARFDMAPSQARHLF